MLQSHSVLRFMRRPEAIQIGSTSTSDTWREGVAMSWKSTINSQISTSPLVSSGSLNLPLMTFAYGLGAVFEALEGMTLSLRSKALTTMHTRVVIRRCGG